MSKLVKREKYTNSKGRRSLKVIVLDLICFSFFAWFTAQNVPKTSAKFGQETKNEGQDNEHPTRNYGPKGESVQILGAEVGIIFGIEVDFIVDIQRPSGTNHQPNDGNG